MGESLFSFFILCERFRVGQEGFQTGPSFLSGLRKLLHLELAFCIRAGASGFGAIWKRFIFRLINPSPLFSSFKSVLPIPAWDRTRQSSGRPPLPKDFTVESSCTVQNFSIWATTIADFTVESSCTVRNFSIWTTTVVVGTIRLGLLVCAGLYWDFPGVGMTCGTAFTIYSGLCGFDHGVFLY